MRALSQLPLQFKDDGNKETALGVYVITHPKIQGDWFFVNIGEEGQDWLFASIEVMTIVSRSQRKSKRRDRFPTAVEVAFVKGLFWEEKETVVQFVPCHLDLGYSVHLWEPVEEVMPMPPAVKVALDLFVQQLEAKKKEPLEEQHTSL